MSDLDLDLLRAWPPEAETPSTVVRAQSRARLEQQYDATPLTSTAPAHRAPATRRFGKRFAIVALAAAVLIAGTIVFVQREVDNRVGELKTVAVPKGVLGAGEVGHGPVNILVIGSDQRDGHNVAAFGSPDQLGPPRSDTMFLLRIDGTSVQGLWIPRDLLVKTAAGSEDIINSTFNQGPAGLIAAIRSNLGVTIDHYVEVRFGSFAKVVDDVGGVPIYSPGVVRDAYSGLSLTGPGCRTLQGDAALAWVRSRHMEILQNGVWADASPRADLDRELRQQEFIRALARKAKTDVAGDPVAAVRLADAIIPALTVDSTFTRAEILGLVRNLIDVDPATLQLSTLPVQAASGPDAAHLALMQPDADQALAAFRGPGTPVTTLPPGAGPEASTTTAPLLPTC